jgi:DNA-binding transcriptional regulator YdaS (Cro superfamily)
MENSKEILLSVIMKAGGQVKLSQSLGISQPAISQWKKVPVHHVLNIEKITSIPRHDLRPDIYPLEG